MTDTDLEQLRAAFFDALNDEDTGRLRYVAATLVGHAADDLTAFHATLNALGFHNHLALVNELMAAAWDQVRDEPSYSRAAVQAYAARATDHLIYAHLEQQTDPVEVSDALIEQLERYFAVDRQRLQPYLQLLSGRMGRQWSPTDFADVKMHPLSGLMVEFLGFASQTGVTYGMGHLVRELMPRYLMDRQAGNLKPKPDMAEALRQGRPLPPSFHEPLHPLIPDQDTLELFLQRVLGTVHPQPYGSAAMLILLPVWNSFIAIRGLAAQEARPLDRASLDHLRRELAPYWDQHPDQSLATFSLPQP